VSRSEEERERARLEREARRAARADRAVGAERPHARQRVESALARSAARRKATVDVPPPPPPTVSAPAQPAQAQPPPPRAPRRRGRWLAPILIGLALLVAAAAWFLVSLYQPGKGAGSGRAPVTIPRGGSLGTIADRLGSSGVIAHPFFFKLRARLGGHTSDLKPGAYVLRKDMAYSDVIDKLTAGPARNVMTVLIPEGRARSEIAPLVKSAGVTGSYVRASKRSSQLTPQRYGAPRGATLEGFLFPATYELKRGASARTLVGKQADAFKRNFGKVSLSYARKKNLTRFDIVTIASMVEREASLDRERPLIAAVIYNRLKQGIPLGIDATIRFATGNWSRPLRVSELRINSRYNTRTHQGLPPGPIGNPGLASLQAAAHPSRVGYLFYVVKPCGNGSHAFSSTDAQFQRDVAKYNSARAKKGGKSPAKC
jgi:peptidoglycan lytic transglycosylase G